VPVERGIFTLAVDNISSSSVQKLSEKEYHRGTIANDTVLFTIDAESGEKGGETEEVAVDEQS